MSRGSRSKPAQKLNLLRRKQQRQSPAAAHTSRRETVLCGAQRNFPGPRTVTTVPVRNHINQLAYNSYAIPMRFNRSLLLPNFFKCKANSLKAKDCKAEYMRKAHWLRCISSKQWYFATIEIKIFIRFFNFIYINVLPISRLIRGWRLYINSFSNFSQGNIKKKKSFSWSDLNTWGWSFLSTAFIYYIISVFPETFSLNFAVGRTSCNKRHKWGKGGNNLGEMGSTLYTQGRGMTGHRCNTSGRGSHSQWQETHKEGDMEQEES